MQNNDTKLVRNITVSSDKLEANLVIPAGANSIVVFAHGSGSSRQSTRNQYVAQVLNDAGFATLLVDLLTREEKEIDERTRHLRFDIGLLANRLVAVTNWLLREPETKSLKIGYFGSSTGAAAVLIAVAKLGNTIKAVVSRGGRPDLAEAALQQVRTPVLLIVGGDDKPIIDMTKSALKELVNAEAKELAIIPGATHLFEEPGKMEEVAEVATGWFESYLLDKKKFENKYHTRSGFSAFFKERPKFGVRFKDRVAAGEMLASILGKYKNKDVTLIGIPRGGVVVANVVASKLNADFDIVIPRKLRAPNNSEDAIGSIMQDGSVYLNDELIKSMEVSNEYLELEKSEQKSEIDRRLRLYRPEAKRYKIKGKTVILVDDGAATGATIAVVARWIKKQEPQSLLIGIPVAPQRVIDRLSTEADHIEVICKSSDSKFTTVEYFYEDFTPVSDSKVIEIVALQRNSSESFQLERE